jgi:hypothetical protein
MGTVIPRGSREYGVQAFAERGNDSDIRQFGA